MVNTRMFEFKHPKYYKELRKLRNKEARRVQGCLPTNELHNSDQAISLRAHDGERERAPDSGLKQEDSSDKQQAAEAQASSYKRSSHKQQD